MATIKKRGNGYLITIEVGINPETGKRKRIYKQVNDLKKVADKVMAQMVLEVENGTYIEPEKITLGEYILKWLDEYGKLNLAGTTLTSYNSILKGRVLPTLGRLPLQKLKKAHIQSYINDLAINGVRKNVSKSKLEPPKLKRSTISEIRAKLHAILETAVQDEIIKLNPANNIIIPKMEEGIEKAQERVRVFNEQQINTLLETLKSDANKKNRYRYYIVYIALMTGLRRGEIFGLSWDDIDFTNSTISVKKALAKSKGKGLSLKKPKNEKSIRVIDISPFTVKTLKEYKKVWARHKLKVANYHNEYDLVFPNHKGGFFNINYITEWFKEYLEKNGLVKLGFHDLRHTHASLMLKAGVNIKIISERLGHSKIGITLDIYSHLIPGMQQEAASKLENLIFGDK